MTIYARKHPAQKTDQKTDQKTITKSTKHKIIQLLTDNPHLTKADMMQILKKSRGTINEHIIDLKDAGRLRRVGGRKNGHWEVSS
jgi:ATP-dependent DNA helicase RecG